MNSHQNLISTDHHHQPIPTDDSFQFDSNDYSDLQLPTQSPLTHELFRSNDFDSDQFLLSRRHTTLNELRLELRNYLNDLKFELVGLINEDYEDFIGLGMGLRGTIERSLIHIKKPIEDCKDQIDEIKLKFEDQTTQLEHLLNERRKVIDGKNLLRLMLDCHEAVCKVEEMLSIKSNHLMNDSSSSPIHHSNLSHHHSIKSNKFSSTKHLNDASFDDPIQFIQEDTKRIERIVFEFNQMLYLVSKASDLNYVANLKPRIDQITQVLHRHLDSLLKNILISPKSDSNRKDRLMECLRAYETLGAVKEAEELIKQELVLPGLRKIIHQNSLKSGSRSPIVPRSPESTRSTIHHQSSSPSSSNLTFTSLSFTPIPLPEDPELVPLPSMYNKILDFITRDLSLVIDIADRQISGLKNSNNNNTTDDKSSNQRSKSYDVLINSIISPTLQSISNTLGPQNLFASGNPINFHRNYSMTSLFLTQLESLSSTNRQLISLRSHQDWIDFKNRWQTAVYAQIRTKETINRVEEGLLDGKADATGATQDGYLLRATETIGLVLETLWREDVFLVDLTHRFWRLTLMTLSRYSTWISIVTVPFISSTNALAAPSNSSSNNRSSSDFNRLTGISTSRATITRPSTPLGSNNPNEEISEDESLKQMSRIMSDIGKLESNVILLFKQSIEPRLPKVTIGPNGLTPEEILMGILEKSTKFLPELITNTSNILIKRSSEKLRLIRSIGSTVRLNKKVPKEVVMNVKKKVIEEIGLKYLNILMNLQKSEESLKKLKKGKKGLMNLFGVGVGVGVGIGRK
ncbi:oligomeric golgi complex component, COG2-domain-containing protein [Melampsora americana]|nr:oligomeric golgi complex component, COG2-domain-containing protein [Melampsora americana]